MTYYRTYGLQYINDYQRCLNLDQTTSTDGTHPKDYIEEKEESLDTAITRHATTRSHVNRVSEARRTPVA